MAMPDEADRNAELRELLNERDRMEDERREENKARRKEIQAVEQRILTLRRILDGEETEELPGTGGVHLRVEHERKGIEAVAARVRGTAAELPTSGGKTGAAVGPIARRRRRHG
jgi:hypothetical protein